MAFGFPAYHKDQYSARDTTADMRGAVSGTLAALSWSVKQETTDGLVASVKWNWRSWGERVLIDFLPDNSVSVTSKCAFRSQCFDWGKNKANVQKFLGELPNHIASSPP